MVYNIKLRKAWEKMTSEKKKRKQAFKDRSNIITLCERHIIDRNHEYFDECDRLTFLAKNLYNATLYQQRQSFFNKSFRNYYDVNKNFTKNNQHDYRMLPAKVAKQVQLLSDKAFKSFFALLKLKEKDEYDEPVKIPKYLDKTKGRMTVPYEKGALSTKLTGFVKLSQSEIMIPTQVSPDEIIGARVVPKGNHFVIEILYDTVKPEVDLDYSKVAFVDPGLNNLMTVTSNVFTPVIYNGKPVKAINQLANKESSKRQSKMGPYEVTPRMKNKDRINLLLIPRLKLDNSNTMKSIWNKRYYRINDHFHKISTHLVNYLVSHDIKTVIFGHNIGQKQNINLGKKTNQNFVNIPFTKLRSMLAYKCLLAGINFITSEEAHTSKCSFIDRETIEHHDSYCGRRVKRGLFKTGSDKLINADVNGSLNIGRKYLEQLGLYTDELHDELLAFIVNPRRITILP